MFKLVSEKAEEPEIKLPISSGSLKKQESSRTTTTSASLTMLKSLTVWITINCGIFLKETGCKIQDAWGWCTGIIQSDGMGREVGGVVQDGEHMYTRGGFLSM